MTQRFLQNTIAILFLLVAYSCSTKLDVNTKNARELIVVYGFLDANHTTQYVRINKAILGKDNQEINDLSKDPSANIYLPSELEAYIQRGDIIKKTNGRVDTIYQEKYTLTPTFYPKRLGGAFNLLFAGADSTKYTGNGMYQCSFPTKPIDDKKLRESVYKLVATVKSKNIIATAVTPLIYSLDEVDSMGVSLSKGTNEFFNNQWFTSGIQLFNPNTASDLAGSRKLNMGCASSINAFKYQLFYRQHITDFTTNDSSTAQVRNYYIDVPLDYFTPEYYIDKNTKRYVVNTSIEPDFYGAEGSFIANGLALELKKLPAANYRKLGIASLVAFTIGEELKTYLDVNNANYGLNIDKPSYSNININYVNENINKQGVGVFSCYTTGSKFHYDVNSFINNVYNSKTYSSNTFYLNKISYQKLISFLNKNGNNFSGFYQYNKNTPYNLVINYPE
jgi:hypothetical protein